MAESMKIKILKTAAGENFAVYEGETREMNDALARELIRAGIAAVVRSSRRKAVKSPPEKAAK